MREVIASLFSLVHLLTFLTVRTRLYLPLCTYLHLYIPFTSQSYVLSVPGVTPTLWSLMGYDGMVIRFEGPDDMRAEWTKVRRN